MIRVCRGLTKDCQGLVPGDQVYVDFAGFVWEKRVVDEVNESHPFMPIGMRMLVGIYRGPRKLLGFIPCGTLVEIF